MEIQCNNFTNNMLTKGSFLPSLLYLTGGVAITKFCVIFLVCILILQVIVFSGEA